MYSFHKNIAFPVVAGLIFGSHAYAQSASPVTQYIHNNLSVSGTTDGSVTADGSHYRYLSDRLKDQHSVIDYGAQGNGSTDDGLHVESAITAASKGTTSFPYKPNGYYLNSGSFPQTIVGHYELNGNMFTGAAIGTPETGSGLFNSPYTNPWNVTTNDRWHYDPAGYGPQKNRVTFEGQSITCGPNHPVSGDSVVNKHWIACVYRGADTGTGGAPGTEINTEVDNDVLNLDTNSGTAYELDVNVNGSVADGGIQRGIFITGGGNAGNNWNGVALDIQHGTYSGTGALNWSAGVSVRNSLRAFLAQAESDGQGSLYSGADKNGTNVFNVDTNGYVTGSAFTGTASEGVAVSAKAGTWRYLGLKTGVNDRWQVGANASPETGSNAGSDFYVGRRDDNGSDIGEPLNISRKTGLVTTANGSDTEHLHLFPHTYAQIPACSAATGGTIEQVTDSNTNSWGDNISGGGKHVVVAFCAGSHWTVMGK